MDFFFGKKEYKAPKLRILDMRGDCCLLAGSGEAPDADEYDDEFGFNHNDGMNRHA